MNRWTTLMLCTAAVLSSPPAMAQDTQRERELAIPERTMSLVQARQQELVERERERLREMREVERTAEREAVDIDIEMREAESRMAEAARRIAELSTRQLPGVSGRVWHSGLGGKPVLGITIGAPDDQGPVEGVDILGVSPGGAAAEAGLRAGDVITAVNDELLSADTGNEANQKLLDFTSGLEEGDVIDVEYLRAGRSATVEVAPRPMSAQVFSFSGPGTDFVFPTPPSAPGAPVVQFNRYAFVTNGQGWGDMEMVKLTEGLGRYFGTDEGLLVVRAPQDETFKLKDGDVILNIDGRTPNSVSHAIRILGSYQEGERLEIRIMRDKREQTLGIEMPQAKLHNSGLDAVIEGAPRVRAPVRVVPEVLRRVKIRPAEERI